MMNRFFPIMTDEPEKGMHFAVLAYWIFGLVLFPLWLPMLGAGLWEDLPVISWFEIGYHVLNAIIVISILKTYLADSFLNVQVDTKKFVRTVVFSAVVMLALALEMYFWLGTWIVNVYPINEMSVAMTSGFLVENRPLFGTICNSLIAPFAVVGLFYVTGFAPVCRRHSWLGYVVVSVVLALPFLFDIFWREEPAFNIFVYLLQLPMHLIACHTYQKADTVWAPIATLALFNLGTSVLAIICTHA